MMFNIWNRNKLIIVLLYVTTFWLSGSVSLVQAQLPYGSSPSWSPDSSKVAIVIDNTVEIIEVSTNQLLYVLNGHTRPIVSVAWSLDSQTIATTSIDQTVKLWSAIDGTLTNTLSGHNDGVTAAIWSPDGTRLVSSGEESEPSLFVWNSATGKLLSTHSGGTIWDAEFSPDGRYFAYIAGGNIQILDGDSFVSISRFRESICCSNPMRSMAWSLDSATIVTGSMNGIVTVWDANTAQPLTQFIANSYANIDALAIDNLAPSWVRDVTFSPDGSTVLAISGDGTLREWSIATNALIQETQVAPLAAAAWSSYRGQLAYLDTRMLPSATANAAQSRSDESSLHIVTPLPSLERLQAIQTACLSAPAVGQMDAQEITLDALPEYVAQVEALTDAEIPPGCAADLVAVAEALIAEGQ